MAVNFPDTPATGEQFVISGKLYIWDGKRWVGRAGAPQVPAIPGDIQVTEASDSLFDPDQDGIDNYIDEDGTKVELPLATLGLVVNDSGGTNGRVLKDSGGSLGYYPQSNTLKASRMLVTNFNVPNNLRNNFLVDESAIEFGPAGNLFFAVDSDGLIHINNITGKRFRTAAIPIGGSQGGKIGKTTQSLSGTFALGDQGNTDTLYALNMLEANSTKVHIACYTDDGQSTIVTNFEVRRVASTIRVVDEDGNVVAIPDPSSNAVIMPTILTDPDLGIFIAYAGSVPGLSLQMGVFKVTEGPATGDFMINTESFGR